MQSAPDAAEGALLEVLRTLDNPFDTFVEPRRRDGAFLRRHVPEVNRTAWECIEGMLGRFRAIARGAHPQSEMPRAGILVVTGPRGAGKTHLLHALESGSDATVVAPSHFDVGRSFGEYVLHELVVALQQELAGGDTRLQRLAETYARDALVVALQQTDELAWLAHNAAPRAAFRRPRLGAPDPESLTSAGELRQRLEREPSGTLAHDVEFSGVAPSAARGLLEAHIQGSERGAAVDAHVRRTLMLHLARSALDEDGDVLLDYLVDGFAEIPGGLQPIRDDLVDALLTSLAQLLFVQERPLILAFDALEAMLGDPPDVERCRTFFSHIANHVDAIPGLLCLVLAEEDYFTTIRRKFASQYAQQRFEQGVPTPRGSVAHVALDPPGAPDVHAIVTRRMGMALDRAGSDGAAAPTPHFPFSPRDLEDVLGREGGLSLRRVLQILRDRYQQLVFGDGRAAETPAPRPLPEPPEPVGREDPAGASERLAEAWERSVRSAQRTLGAQVVTSHADRIHMGLEAWLAMRSEAEEEGADLRLLHARHEVFGTHPTYGQHVRCRWRRGDGESEQSVALLLGRGPGMPRDLAEKVGAMERDELGVGSMHLLWPTAKTVAGGPVEALPPGTRAVWEQEASEATRRRIRLVPIAPELLAFCLAFLEWRQRWHEIEDELEPATGLGVVEGRMRRLWNAIRREE